MDSCAPTTNVCGEDKATEPERMDYFIGVKLLQAKPMNLGDYNRYRGWDIPANEDPNRPGYLVKYSDTYESWSPKEIFESAFMSLGDGNDSRITQNMVDDFVGRPEVSQISPKSTLVKVTPLTGFEQFEVSSCVDPANYSQQIGEDVAMDRIKNRIWGYLGFVLQWAKYGLKQ